MLKLKALLLAAIVLIVPACGGNVNVPPPLLSDSLSSPFPDSNWSPAATTGSGTTTQTTGGVLAFTTSTAGSSSKTTTTASFNNPSLTMTVQMAASPTSRPGVGTIEILNGSSAVVAFVSWDVGAGTIDYSIAGSSLTPPVSPPPSDGTLTAFRFSVDSSGTASWVHNNVGVAMNASFPAGPLSLRLGGTWATGGSPFAEFDFANVTVTSP